MFKVVINNCYGNFSLSEEASKLLAARKGVEHVCVTHIDRHDADLIAVVEELGCERASGEFAELYIEEIKGNQYNINEYDGAETVITPEGYRWITIS